MDLYIDTPEPKVRPPSGKVSHFYILGDWDSCYLNENITTWLQEARLNRPSFYRELTRSPTSLPFLGVFTNVVETVFRIGDDLELSKDVQFLTIDVFDRYCMRRFEKYSSKIFSKGFDEALWIYFKRKVADEYLIRLLSCMQLASKYLYTTTEVITTSVLKHWLDNVGLEGSNPTFTIQEIRKSEIRVLSDLNFEIGRGGNNVLFYVECLVYTAVQEEVTDPELLYQTVLRVQGVAYLKRQEIYHKLYNAMTNAWERDVQARLNSLPMECDSLLLAAGIVLTSVFLLTRERSLVDKIATNLSRAVSVPSSDISNLCKILLHLIVD